MIKRGCFYKRSSVIYDTRIKWIAIAAKEALRQIVFEFAQLMDTAGASPLRRLENRGHIQNLVM